VQRGARGDDIVDDENSRRAPARWTRCKLGADEAQRPRLTRLGSAVAAEQHPPARLAPSRSEGAGQ